MYTIKCDVFHIDISFDIVEFFHLLMPREILNKKGYSPTASHQRHANAYKTMQTENTHVGIPVLMVGFITVIWRFLMRNRLEDMCLIITFD